MGKIGYGSLPRKQSIMNDHRLTSYASRSLTPQEWIGQNTQATQSNSNPLNQVF